MLPILRSASTLFHAPHSQFKKPGSSLNISTHMDTVEGRLRLRKLPHLKPLEMGTVKEDEDESLSPMARMFHKPDSNMYIICMLGLKKKVFWTDAMKDNLLHSPLLKHPRFSCLLVMDAKVGEMKWVPTEIDIEKHVIVPDFQEEMDTLSSADKFIEDYISNLSKTTIDMSKPLWDIHILNLKNSEKEDEAEGIAILRVHHSLGDGMSLMSLLFATARKSSDQSALPTIPGQKKKVTPKYSSKLGGGTRGFGYVLRKVWNTIVDVFMFLATKMWLLKDTQTPLKGHMNGGEVESSTPRRIVHRAVSLDDVKFIKNATNTTINDVLIGIIQAGLSRYLNRKYGELAKKDECTNYLPKNIRLRALVFMNIRPVSGIHALADMMEKGTKAKWGNQIGYVLLPFTIALRKNPLDYVRDAKVVMDRKKASFEALCTYFISMLMLKFGTSSKIASFPSPTTMWFSNVVGPQEEISLFGSPVAYIGASCYGQPIGLLIHVVSYINKIRFVLSVDEDTIPDPHQLCDDLEESLKHIKETATTNGA